MGEQMLNKETWWKKGVIYQIYPRSFMDTNGDGIGDIQGIISKLDYLNDGTENSLGVDALWISPIYESPMKDFGYDISDYKNIDKMFGNLGDFKQLLSEAHKRNIKIIMDLVINHTSDQHPWFKEARENKESPKRDWFIWQPKKGKKKPNNWFSLFDMRNAWCLDEKTNEYYLATFTKYQPEVNWYNDELKKEMYDMIRFWFDMGIDGFRIDVINWFIKDNQLRNNPWKLSLSPMDIQKHIYDRNRPEVHTIVKELRAISDEYEEKMYVGEVFTSDSQEAVKYQGNGEDELHLAFNFNFLFEKWSAKGFYNKITEWYSLLPESGWPNFTLSNHDQPRHYYRYRNGEESDYRARVAAAMLLTLKGTPFLYYGEEIGMTCGRLHKSELMDPVGVKYWPFIKGRDGERTPMQWNDTENAGFSFTKPWLPVNSDYKTKNVDKQLTDKNSLLSFYKKLIWLRKSNPALSMGDIDFLIPDPKNVLAYKRSYNGQEIIVFLNFSNKKTTLHFGIGEKSILFGSHREVDQLVDLNHLDLLPYEVLLVLST